MPTKWLPDSANLDHLKHQAKDLLRDFRSGQMAAFQRIREFHPKFRDVPDPDMPLQTFSLSDAYLSIAREYGYSSWPRLKAVIAERLHEELQLSQYDRIPDGPFKQALDFMDEGDTARLIQQLAEHPDLVHERMFFEGGNYFSNPTLLEFLPENPVRQGKMPDNALEIAEILLKSGAKDNLEALNETLGLTSSGRVCRECGHQSPLLRLLCRYGATPAHGMKAALAHMELEAVRTLLDCGAPLDLAAAATLGDRQDVDQRVRGASGDELQLALAFASNADRAEIITMLIASGADPNQYNPPGGHSHCTPLHSAVASDQFNSVVALVEGGASLEMTDIHHHSTALDWAEYLKRDRIADYLRSRG